ncbi:MAG: FAD-dependent oxidoreductase [Sulfitobacter sp.]
MTAARFDVVILGGGIAGLAAAGQLAKRGDSVLVLEGATRLGGMHKSVDIGPYTFDIGSIFYEPSAKIFELATGLEDQCPTTRRIQRRLLPDGSIRHYPIDPGDVVRWPLGTLVRAMASMLLGRMKGARGETLEDICLARLGRVFFEETGLRNYTVHFNGVPPALIGREFYDSRMRFVHQATSFHRIARAGWRALTRRKMNKTPRPPLHIRPVEGYDALFERISKQLVAQGVTIRTGCTLERISGTAGAMTVQAGGAEFTAETVVGAMPLNSLHQALFDAPAEVQSLDLLSLFVSAEWLHPNSGNVFFNFHSEGGWKRATVYSRLYPGTGEGREYFTVEVTVPPGQKADKQAAFEAFAAHAEKMGFARGVKLEGGHLAQAAYPVYSAGQMAMVPDILARITQAGVIPVGRQGRFEYLPTASGVIRRVREVLDDH